MTGPEKYAKLRAMFPTSQTVDQWVSLSGQFQGCIRANGSIDLRHAVKLTTTCTGKVWRLDRITTRGAEKFIGYAPMTDIEAALYC